MKKELSGKHLVYYTYLLGFLLAIHSYLPIYINSSFLERFVGSDRVGILFTLSALLSLIGFFIAEKIIRRHGNFLSMLLSLVIQFFLFLFLSYGKNPVLLIAVFIFGQIGLRTLLFNIDVFLESETSNKDTGRVRGLHLTITNLVLVIMPFIAGFLSHSQSYSLVYFFSAIALLPVILLLILKFRHNKIKISDRGSFWESFSKVLAHADLRRIFICNLILRTFYAIMIVYLPLHLHLYLKFSWEEIGLMLSIMLLPFVIFELPLGKLADSQIGEKEILSVGFFLTGITTCLIFLNPPVGFLAWATLLFLTRIGASAIEIMTETYFFKKVSVADSGVISLYRMADALGYVIGPVLGSAILLFYSTSFLFLVLGLILLLGLRYSLTLKDTV